MFNPALTEMVANDRIAELRRVGAPRSSCARRSALTEIGASSRSNRRDHLAGSQRAIGWFLVSVGLRLVVPRTRTGPAR
jgi:hypothetical protein